MLDLETELTIDDLLCYAKAFSGLLPEDEACLKQIAPFITPHLEAVTDSFYLQLSNIPQAAIFLEGRINILKPIHLNWLNNLFIQDIDVNFVKLMHKTGNTHSKVLLPIEFMVGAMTLITNALIKLVFTLFSHDPEQCQKAIKAINAITGFSLNLMLYSFHALNQASKAD